MGNFVTMPKLGMTMTDGKITRWLKKEGDQVQKGENIFEVETDKTTLEVDSLYSGILLKKYYPDDSIALCNSEVGFIGEAGEAIPEITLPAAASGTGEKPAAAIPAPLEAPAEKIKAAPLAADDKTSYEYDLAIIGAGPGGYVAALRAAQLGAKTVVIEKDELGGTCLNRGCIPTKALYTSAKQFRKILHANEYGIKVAGAEIDFPAIMDRKDRIVKKLTNGVGTLLNKQKVDVIRGVAKIQKEHEIIVGDRKIICKYAILATGGKPASVLKNIGAGVEIYDTDKLMGLKQLPESAVVVGGGIIGCEIGCILNAFGVHVTIIELLPEILPMVDKELVDCLAKKMRKNGIDIRNSTTVDAIEKSGDSYSVKLSDGQTVSCGMVFEAVGRKVDGTAYENLGIKLSPKGFIETDAFGCTSLPGIYAIGDITGKWQLAHAASEQGIAAVERLFGGKTEAEEQNVPSCIFTDLEIATVGLTEAQAKAKGLKTRSFKFHFSANGKALTLGESEGFVKVVCDERFGEILGVHIIGPEASSLIHEAVMAMRLEATAEFAGSTIHAHPTLSEALMEAFLGCSKGALHA